MGANNSSVNEDEYYGLNPFLDPEFGTSSNTYKKNALTNHVTQITDSLQVWGDINENDKHNIIFSLVLKIRDNRDDYLERIYSYLGENLKIEFNVEPISDYQTVQKHLLLYYDSIRNKTENELN